MTGTVNDEPARKVRHDAFDGKRKRAFLDALGKNGCLRAAARRAGVSHQTVYNHQRTDRAFARQCELALEMASTDLELEAWERAVKGEEVPIVHRGEVVGGAINLARDLANTPPREKPPRLLAARAREVAEEAGATATERRRPCRPCTSRRAVPMRWPWSSTRSRPLRSVPRPAVGRWCSVRKASTAGRSVIWSGSSTSRAK